MDIDIYFATDRLTITTTRDQGGYELTPTPDRGIDRTDLLELFRDHKWITLTTTSDEESLDVFDHFATQFTRVTAAGGVVERDDERILMIHRNGRWDLPKGHWEEGETIEECAVREVEEESGVSGITLVAKICSTLHAYYMKGRWELKRTEWYSMTSSDRSELTPQTEEGIDRAEWLTEYEVELAIEGSFPTIRDVMTRY
ncbi:MAG: NUDIX domain-containing protein [Rikenellaceae bacterium]